MTSLILTLYRKCEKILQYLFFSILSTILDVTVVWISFHILNINLTISNTIGVILGFFVSYILSSKTIFDTKFGFSGFAIYFSTFILGLFLANYLITTSYEFSIIYCAEWLAFLFSKGVSIVVPFFALYFSRKYLYIWLNQRRSSHE